jgi:hypothetical protein
MVSYGLDDARNVSARMITGQVRSNCAVIVDVTVGVRWADGAYRGGDPVRFVTLRRVQPNEVRAFSAQAIGGLGATRAEFTFEVDESVSGRRR